MCRIAAYVGPARPLSALFYEPAHGLESQAYRPREMQLGTVNVDGTGVVWWPTVAAEPLRYVTVASPWADANLPTLAPRLEGEVILAAVRSATPGMPHGPGAVGPFLHDGIALAHNGWIERYHEGIGRELDARLPDDLFAATATATDSTMVFGAVLRHIREREGDLAAGLAAGVAEVATACTDAGVSATLNVVCTDGRGLAATRASVGLPCNSLYHLPPGPVWGDAVLVASEPLDDGPWEPVPDGHLLALHDGGVTLTLL